MGQVWLETCSQSSGNDSFGTVTGCHISANNMPVWCLWFDSGHEKEILLFYQTLEPTQSPIQCVTGSLSPRVKQSGHEADQAPPSAAYIKNV
jgi:hypothetical protein